MSSTNQEITALRSEVTNLASRLLSVTPNQIVPVVVGEFILFGCKVTEGPLSTDFIVSLEGQASGDSANLNPKLSATPSRGFEFPNIASTIGGMLATNDLTATVGAAPATGTARYDIAFVFAGKEGAGFNIQPGSPAVAVKTDFDANGLDSSPFGEATITDPDLPIGALAVARIYVEDVFTGIQDARIADIRDFLSTLVGNSFAIPPVLGSTTPNAISGTTGDFSSDVGIGTSSPLRQLHVDRNNTSVASQVLLRNQGTGDAGLEISAGSGWFVGVDNSAGDLFGIQQNSSLNSAVDFSITPAGDGKIRGKWNVGGDLDPAVTETQDIGNVTFEWDNIFLQNSPTVCDSRRKNLIGSIIDASTFLDKLIPVLFSRKNRVVKEAIPARTEQRQKTETVSEERIEIIDGVPTLKVVEFEKPLFKSVQLVDTQGKKVKRTIPAIKDKKGKVIEPERIEDRMVDVPDMEDYDIPAVPEIVTTHSRPHSGFMAQDVKQAMTDAGILDWAGYAYYDEEDVHVLRLMEFISYLVKGHQELSERIKTLEGV